jgi:hypothetical protein
VECSKLSNCCDKEKNKNKQKNTTLSEQFQNQLLVFWYFTGLVQELLTIFGSFTIFGTFKIFGQFTTFELVTPFGLIPTFLG